MAGQEAEVKVRLKAEGAEETKQRLLETRAALVGVSSEQLQNAQTQRQAARDAQVLNNAEAYKNRIYLAQHPAINQLTRSMRDFGSISRGVLSITTAFSTAITAFNSTESGLGQISADLEQAKREQAFALKTYGYDSKEYADATDKVNGLQSQFDGLQKQVSTEKMAGILNAGAAIGLMASEATKLIPLAPALIPFMAAIAAIGAVWYLLNNDSGDFVKQVKDLSGIDLSQQKEDIQGIFDFLAGALPNKGKQTGPFDWLISPIPSVRKIITQFFGRDVPDALQGFNEWVTGTWVVNLKAGMISVWNGIMKINELSINGILTGAEAMANGFVNAINALIDAWNSIPNNPFRIGKIGNVSIPRVSIPAIAAANGADFMTNGPTLMLVGEAGPEHVSVTPSGSSRGGGGIVMNNYFHFEGSLRSSQDFKRDVDAAMKETLKRHGWT